MEAEVVVAVVVVVEHLLVLGLRTVSAKKQGKGTKVPSGVQ